MINLSQVETLVKNNFIFTDVKKDNVLRAAKFIIDNESIHFYPLIKLQDISGCEGTTECLDIARYLCGERIKLLVPRYCYIEVNGNELPLTQDEFKEALTSDNIFTSYNHGIIHNFSKDQLNMYFIKYVAPDVVITRLEL